MNLISEIHGKSSERTVSNAVAGYVVPITALGLSSLFDTMKKKKANLSHNLPSYEGCQTFYMFRADTALTIESK
jgi:thiamine transporter ThiT